MPNEQRDVYYRRAKQEGWRARSAFKLLQIDEVFDIFSGMRNVVDLCAAPGSWSQVLSRRLFLPLSPAEREAGGSAIVAVDLQPIGPIEGVRCIQGDITSEATARAIMAIFHGRKADLVVCDGAPDVTGLHDCDEWLQAQLLLAALAIAVDVLQPGGAFVAKIFTRDRADLLYSQMRLLFREVHVYKPQSSRASSAESFIVCKGLQLPPGVSPRCLLAQWQAEGPHTQQQRTPEERALVPFLFGGDLSGYDSSSEAAVDATV